MKQMVGSMLANDIMGKAKVGGGVHQVGGWGVSLNLLGWVLYYVGLGIVFC